MGITQAIKRNLIALPLLALCSNRTGDLTDTYFKACFEYKRTVGKLINKNWA